MLIGARPPPRIYQVSRKIGEGIGWVGLTSVAIPTPIYWTLFLRPFVHGSLPGAKCGPVEIAVEIAASHPAVSPPPPVVAGDVPPIASSVRVRAFRLSCDLVSGSASNPQVGPIHLWIVLQEIHEVVTGIHPFVIGWSAEVAGRKPPRNSFVGHLSAVLPRTASIRRPRWPSPVGRRGRSSLRLPGRRDLPRLA